MEEDDQLLKKSKDDGLRMRVGFILDPISDPITSRKI